MIEIRTASASDATTIASLHTQSWQLTYRGIFSDHYLNRDLAQHRREHWEKALNQPAKNQYVIVAADTAAPEQLLGFACAFGKNEEGSEETGGTLIDNLHAHPTHKKSGIGRKLFNHVVQWSAERFPGDAVYLWVVAENTQAIGFYKYLGGVEDQQSFWETPDGKQVPVLRFIWNVPELAVFKD